MNDEQSATMYCAIHRNPTHVRCGRCDTPICPQCMVFGPLGQRCSYGCRKSQPYRRGSHEQTPRTNRGSESRFWIGILLGLAAIGIIVWAFYNSSGEPTERQSTESGIRMGAPVPTRDVQAAIEATVQAATAADATSTPSPSPNTQIFVQAAIDATVQAVTAADATSTPSPSSNTQTMVQAAIKATVQSITAADTTSTPSPSPNTVSAVLPTATPTPSPTAAPTTTPLPTVTPTNTPLPTATLSPTPAPAPAVSIEDIARLQFQAGQHASFLVSARNLTDGQRYKVQVSITSGNIGFDSNCTSKNWEEHLHPASGSSYRSSPLPVLYICGTSPGSASANLYLDPLNESPSLLFTHTVTVSVGEPPHTSTPISTSPTTTDPTSTPIPTAVPTNTPPPTATPTNTPSPILPAGSSPSERHIDMKRYMLHLINNERARAGVDPVVLGDNVAAQLHAESSLANCFSSHWGIDGLKPYMRYSLAGGYQSNGENGSGLDYCIPASGRVGTTRYRAIGSIEQEVRETMDGLMDSPGHRRNILDPWHKKVNIGLAWDTYNFFAYQHFEGDYVEYDQLPAIENGILTLSGTVKNGAGFADERDLGVQIYYDPPTHTLTQGQVSRTYCYDSGLQIAALRRPLPPNRFYPEHEFTKTYKKCPDPYEVPADAPAPRSPAEAHAFWEAAYQASQLRPEQPIIVPWITALEWTATADAFAVRADISDLLAIHGDGVYLISVWGVIDGERVIISDYSIFHGVTPPDTYDPGRYD